MRTRLALLVLAFATFSAQISHAQDPLTQSMQQMGQQQAQRSLDMAMQQSAQQAQALGQQMSQQSNFAMQQAMWSSNHGFPALLIPAAPKFSPKPGEYSTAKTVRIHDATPGAAIHYTLDGSRRTAAFPLYTGPIPINSSTTIQAVAIGHNRFWSPVVTGVYKLTTSPANPAAQPPQSPEQNPALQSEEQAQPQSAPAPPIRLVTIPAGTKLALALMDPIYTKTARPGDNVYWRRHSRSAWATRCSSRRGHWCRARLKK
jgi:Chitobiase/beta-hexosaminidase C-terminal domain